MKAAIAARAPWGPIPLPPAGWTWESLMGEALDVADDAGDGEIPVGAVVVAPDGRIVAKAANGSIGDDDPSAHAEVVALRRAGRTLHNYRLVGCVLVVTLEPCLMCVGAMVHARIDGVVYGASDLKAGAVESCLNAADLPFLNHRVWHYGGVLSEICSERLKDFFAGRRPLRLDNHAHRRYS